MLETRCSICKQIKKEMLEDKKGESQLERRLYHCKFFDEFGESHNKIAEEFGFNRSSMLTHLKYHQNPDKNKLVESKFERNLAKQGAHNEMRAKMADLGMTQLEKGEFKMNAATLRNVLKDQADLEEKQKDRAVQMMELYFAALSGELEPNSSTTESVIDVEEV